MDGNDSYGWETIVLKANFDQYMPLYRFKEFRKTFHTIYQDKDLQEQGDPWWHFASTVLAFNSHQCKVLSSSTMKTLDKLMPAFKPRTTLMGNIPNLSYF